MAEQDDFSQDAEDSAFAEDFDLSWDDADVIDAVVDEKLADAMTPGFKVEFAPDEAERAGAFVERALSAEAAYASAIDLLAYLRGDDSEE